MEENEKKVQNFKTVQNPNTYKTVYKDETISKSKSGFGKSILLPFCSGVLGATLVVGTCFGVPQIRTYLMGKTEFVQTSSPSRKCRNT